MKSRKIILFGIVLLVLTGLFGFLYLNSREDIPENSISMVYKDKTYLVDIDKLEYEQIIGIRVNGKGEEIKIDADGIELKDLFVDEEITGYSIVTLEADDSYSANVSSKEVNESNKVCLLKEENTLRLVVFGDKNSKRSVSNIVKIIIE